MTVVVELQRKASELEGEGGEVEAEHMNIRV